MTIFCGPANSNHGRLREGDRRFVLYDKAGDPSEGSAGMSLLRQIQKDRIVPSLRAWDLLSIALSIICADTAERRNKTPDGWTRQVALEIAVGDPDFWNNNKSLLERQLKFLTTDRWQLKFIDLGLLPEPPKRPEYPDRDCVSLLSGGLDSFVGAIDLFSKGKKPYFVSQVSRGDKCLQRKLASMFGEEPNHLQLNHNVKNPGKNETSQRSRSIIFLAYGVLAATALKKYKEGECVDLYVSENGLISINPPLTLARIGSLSTRTTHPIFLNLFQNLLDAAELKINIFNPYKLKTKGEMLRKCKNQDTLERYASETTSCGRFIRRQKHCGRCLPCLIRRAAFHKWKKEDTTDYIYSDLSKNHPDFSRFDDVRCAAMAVASVKSEGIDSLATTNLNAFLMGDLAPYREMLDRGIRELGEFLDYKGVR
ncbi:Qat anti-phage system QueC-like protein QatC [Thioalkalivibrio sp. HK1]|uniref:Qat anti-phage system QueC-like protein QatC n=1 Tax=Thioalkalivibrio sp. HK1 TaxID=1469245 RepID=UPI0004B826DB|nr:Qat anti-phage system QueC-like protein QatC [Thioalkalivibrio sp. HK1]